MIKKAIISVSDRTGLRRVIEEIKKNNVELIATSGTADYIEKIGFKVTRVSDYIGMQEMPEGLVKTLHPKIHCGIQGDMENDEQRNYIENYGIEKIDLVIVNFYPLKKNGKENLNFRQIADMMDIGGPALAKSAAKAALLYGKVTVLTSPKHYDLFLEEIKRNIGETSQEFKSTMAVEALTIIFGYESRIQKFLNEVTQRERC